jgi:hypothetical protein
VSVQEQYSPAVRVSEESTGPIATISCDSAKSYAYYVNLPHTNWTLSHEQQTTLPNPNILCQIGPSVTSESSNTAYSGGYCSDANTERALSSDLLLSTSHLSQPSPLSPRPVPLAMPRHKEIHVEPSGVSNSPRSSKPHIMWMYVRVEV